MLFRKKIERSCSYCQRSVILEDGRILCAKNGVTEPKSKCFWFHYDPLKRIPSKMKALDFSKYDNEDYSL